jgi:hypothetical protein
MPYDRSLYDFNEEKDLDPCPFGKRACIAPKILLEWII